MREATSGEQASDVDLLLESISAHLAEAFANHRELTSCVTTLQEQLTALQEHSGRVVSQSLSNSSLSSLDDNLWEVPVEPMKATVISTPSRVESSASRPRLTAHRSQGVSVAPNWATSSVGKGNQEELCDRIGLMFKQHAEQIVACLDGRLSRPQSFCSMDKNSANGESLHKDIFKSEVSEPVEGWTWKPSLATDEQARRSRALCQSSHIWENQSSPSASPTAFRNYYRRKLKKLVYSNCFEFTFAMLILSNAVYLGIETDVLAQRSNRQTPLIFHVIQYAYTVMFIIELILRWSADGFFSFLYESRQWAWNCFDILTVIASMVEATLTTIQLMGDVQLDDMRGISNVRLLRIIRVARLLRVFRISRILRFVGALRTLVYSIIGTLVSLFWALVLLILIMYSFGVVFTQAAGDHMSDKRAEMEAPTDSTRSLYSITTQTESLGHYWGSLSASMFTLFMSIAAGISWELVVDPLKDIGWFFPALFSMFIAFTYFAVLNIVTANFCQSAIDNARYDRDMVVESVIRTKTLYSHLLKRLFFQLDTNKSGSVSLRELQGHFEDPEVQAYFSSLDLEAEDAWTLFKLLDENQGDDIDLDEFVTGCMRLRGNAKKIDLAVLIENSKHTSKQLTGFMEHVDNKLQGLKALIRQSMSMQYARPLLAVPAPGIPRTPKEPP